LDTVAEGRISAAIEGLDRLIEHHPNFRLAHLVRKRQYWVPESYESAIRTKGAGS
jgi:hypothetical protein